AQRSSAISEGRILLSKDFINSPYVLVKFSGYLQQFVRTQKFGILREAIKDYDFLKNAEINMRRTAGSPRLAMTVDNQTVPYMSWSTGQREFTPLLMALDYFESIDNKEYIVIEEPELGLHPRAIIEFMFTVLKLMKKGVKVVISTHSSTPLDFVWAMNRLKHKGVKSFAALAEMFDFKIKDKDFFDGLFEKEVKVYYFAPDPKTRKVHSKDISSLDVESEDEDISNWGGMSLSADRAGSIVSKF
ncbi:MAG: AAA family ATPase, partial [Bacteroidales bacterium]|nr:AAA family ATPase [Bacteroidales bacterium]